jgi:hypothetical protein
VPKDECVDFDVVAQYLALDLITVMGFVESGQLPVTSVYRVSMAALEAFVEGCRIQPGTLAEFVPVAQSRNLLERK